VIRRNDHLTGNPLLGAGAVHHINSGLMHRSKKDHHSITSSARLSNDCGTVRPSALAVLRLMTSLILGRSLYRKIARLLASQNAIDVSGSAAVLLEKIESIRNQSASVDEVASIVDRRQVTDSTRTSRNFAKCHHRTKCEQRVQRLTVRPVR